MVRVGGGIFHSNGRCPLLSVCYVPGTVLSSLSFLFNPHNKQLKGPLPPPQVRQPAQGKLSYCAWQTVEDGVPGTGLNKQ